MKIDIQRLREGPITENVFLSPEYLWEEGEEGMSFEPGRGEVTFRMVGDDILATGTLRSVARASCGRCLEDAAIPLEANVRLFYWPKREKTGSKIADIDPEEPDFGEYEGDSIEPDGDFRELLLVEVPPFVVCGDQCKGLCPQCGANLNKGDCGCEEKEETPGGEKAAPKESPWKAQLRSIRLPPGN